MLHNLVILRARRPLAPLWTDDFQHFSVCLIHVGVCSELSTPLFKSQVDGDAGEQPTLFHLPHRYWGDWICLQLRWHEYSSISRLKSFKHKCLTKNAKWLKVTEKPIWWAYGVHSCASIMRIRSLTKSLIESQWFNWLIIECCVTSS